MAAMVGLSRSRFYDLCRRGVFPQPIYDTRSKRPYFSADLQSQCLEIRRSGVGASGEFHLFYRIAPKARTGPSRPSACKRLKASNGDGQLAQLVEALGQLGLTVSANQVTSAVAELFPDGLPDTGGETIRTIFLHLRRSVRG